jgi:Bacterial extracellular solute-binding proteins, family 5 Middle
MTPRTLPSRPPITSSAQFERISFAPGDVWRAGAGLLAGRALRRRRQRRARAAGADRRSSGARSRGTLGRFRTPRAATRARDRPREARRRVRGRWDAVEAYDPLLAPGGDLARRVTHGESAAAISYLSFPAPSTSYLALNASRPPFSDARLRRAVAATIDRAALADFWSQTPTDHLLPPAVRDGRPAGIADPVRIHRRRTNIAVRMGVQAGDDRGRQFADLVHTALAPLGINVQAVFVKDLAAALPDPTVHIELAAGSTSIDYPDPATFLVRMLGRDVPTDWLPANVRIAVVRLAGLTGARRDRAAAALARSLGTRDVPVVAYGTPTLGAVVGHRLGCRIWNGTDQGLDLSAICLKPS